MTIKMSGDLWIQTSLFMAALIVTLNGEGLTWIESLSTCQLASKTEAKSINKTITSSWIGGYYVTSPWISYEGCYRLSVPTNISYHTVTTLPVDCLEKCENVKYFAITKQQCICLDDRDELHEARYENCNATCRSSSCSYNIKPRHVLLYSRFEKSPANNLTYQYNKASQQCDIIGFDDIYNRIFTEGLQYWINTRRFRTLKWIHNSTFKEISDEVSGYRKSICMSAEWNNATNAVSTVHLPCDNRLPYICASSLHTETAVKDTEDNATAMFTTSTSIIQLRNDITNKTGEAFTISMGRIVNENIVKFVAIGLLSVGFTMTSLYIILKNCQTRQRYSRRLDVYQMGKITGNPEPYYAEINDIEGRVVNTDVPLNQEISNFRNFTAPIQQPIELRELNDITGGENDNYLTPYHPLDD